MYKDLPTYLHHHSLHMLSCTCVLLLHRWRGKVILLRIPVRDRPEVQLKAIAYGALQKQRKQWGHSRKWMGNYLGIQAENVHAPMFENSLTTLKRSHDFEKILFSCNVNKVRVILLLLLLLFLLYQTEFIWAWAWTKFKLPAFFFQLLFQYTFSLGAKCRIGCLWEDFSKIALELYYAKISTRVICSFILSQNRS